MLMNFQFCYETHCFTLNLIYKIPIVVYFEGQTIPDRTPGWWFQGDHLAIKSNGLGFPGAEVNKKYLDVSRDVGIDVIFYMLK